MEITIASKSGFCDGVSRAFSLVEKEFRNAAKNSKVFIFGSLVHNDSVAKIIEEWGVEKISDLEGVGEGDFVIVTAHGAGEDLFEDIKKRGAKVFDATCPKVIKVQRLAKHCLNKNSAVVIFGDPDHKEVRGINGWCQNKGIVISSIFEAKALSKAIERNPQINSVSLLAQTTQNKDIFLQIEKMLAEVCKKWDIEFRSFNTICLATEERQKEVKELAEKNDALVVVGGKESANTKRLWQIAKEINANTIWVDGLKESDRSEISKKIKGSRSVGIVSGASTPDWQIAAIRDFVLEAAASQS